MDDVWGNAWSSAGSSSDVDAKKSAPAAASSSNNKWNTFERDADSDTIDLAGSSWNPAASAGLPWDGGSGNSNMWHAESPALDTWSAERLPEVTGEDTSLDAAAAVVAPPFQADMDEEAEEDKSLAPRAILPTPPQSPLPSPSPTPSPTILEDPPPASPEPPASPDPFQSFESADPDIQQSPSWALKSPGFLPEAVDEPWGSAWRAAEGIDKPEADQKSEPPVKDEWDLAREAKRRHVPAQLLTSLITQWDEYAGEIFPTTSGKADGADADADTQSQSWRKGLDNVEGFADILESLAPAAASFAPPPQFSKTALCKALRESLRHTRSFHITRSSPMAHLYASKGSTDWERSVKAQKAAATDEWGWDLKHEQPEEKHGAGEGAVEKKAGGRLLAFWSRKAAPVVATETVASPPPPKSPPGKVTTPTSARASGDGPRTASPTVLSPQPGSAPPPSQPPSVSVTTALEPATADGGSAVSRFFNRFSRKQASLPTPPDKEDRSPILLSEDDLSVLSGVVPSPSSSSTSVLQESRDSVGSLAAMLSPQNSGTARTSSKLPPPLAPPPRPPPPPSIKSPSTASDTSFDLKMAEAQLLDVFESAGMASSGSGSGYTPVSFDVESPVEEPKLPSSTMWSPVSPVVAPPSSPQHQRPPVPAQWSSLLASAAPSSGTANALPPPTVPAKPMAPLFGTLAPSTPPPAPRSSTPQRQENSLPQTPQRNTHVDDFSEFFSASTSASPSRLVTTPSSSTQPPLNTLNNDFGEFISQSAQQPNISHKANVAATQDLVDKAASRTGRWPAPPSPLPQRLAPPPPGQGYFSRAQQDLLGDSPSKPAAAGAVAPAMGQPRSSSVAAFTLPPPPAPPVLTPRLGTTSPTSPKKPSSIKSGSGPLSAQDISFFEGL